MGKGTGVVGIEGPIHHQLQIGEQHLRSQTVIFRLHRWQNAQAWQWRAFGSATKPHTELP